MKIYDLRYERTFKIADYEPEKYALSAILDEGENAVEAFSQMKGIVADSFGGKSVAAVEKTTTTPVAKAKAVKESAPKTEAPKKEEVKEEVKEEPKKEEVKEAKKEEPKKEKKKVSSITAYVRQNDDHRGKMGSLIDSVCPTWRENPKAKEAAKLASTELEGKDFLDEKGNFVDSFLAEVKTRMAPFMKDDL